MNRFVAFSGGIDSTALALTVEDATPIFTDTQWEFPDLYAHIDKFEQVTGRKVECMTRDAGIPGYIESAKFMPSYGARWCTRMFKIEVMNDFMKSRLPCELLIGLRADEPERRGNLTELDGLTIRYPLRELGMKRRDCIRVCVENDLLPHYPVYMVRGGCVGCFYKRKSEVLAMIALQPEVMDKLQALEEGVQDERGKFFRMFPNTNASIRELRSQGNMFAPEEVYRDASISDAGDNCGLFCHR
jgi:hypothetical protein